MSASAEATTLEERPRRPRVRSRVAIRSEERRDQDAVAIGTSYRKGREAIVESVRCNLQAGRKLIRKKDSMPHGEWVSWLRANADLLGFKHRTTAWRLMKAAADALTHQLTEVEAHPDQAQAMGQSGRRGHSKRIVQGNRGQGKGNPRDRARRK